MIRLTESDLRFLVETVATNRTDLAQVAALVRDKEDLLDPMLDDPRLLDRLLSDDEALVHISPWMFFTVLLRRVRRDLEQEAFVYEIGARGERIPIFEARQVVELLADAGLRDYLTDMLASFTRTNTAVVYSRRRGHWQKRRLSDLDMDDMIALAQMVPDDVRPALYKRIADIALFLSGVYPDHASLFVARPRNAFQGRRTLRDYETEGQRFYGLAAREAEPSPVRAACETLSGKFVLARRALNTLSDRYLESFKAGRLSFPGD